MPPEIWQAAALGVVQGLTEFLPISSTGHLLLVPALLGWRESLLNELEFAAALHLGTLAALLGVFGKEWVRLARAGVAAVLQRSLAESGGRLAWLVVAATVPAAVAGAVLESVVETTLRSPIVVGTMMMAVALLLAAADRWSKRTREEDSLGLRAALSVGFGQALALVPGVSRSGITIATGLAVGLTRPAAARFSFLLSAPIIGGAAGKQILDLLQRGLATADMAPYGVGIAAAAISGYFAIRWLLAYLARGSLAPFVVYRLVVGSVVLALAAAGRM